MIVMFVEKLEKFSLIEEHLQCQMVMMSIGIERPLIQFVQIPHPTLNIFDNDLI